MSLQVLACTCYRTPPAKMDWTEMKENKTKTKNRFTYYDIVSESFCLFLILQRLNLTFNHVESIFLCSFCNCGICKESVSQAIGLV